MSFDSYTIHNMRIDSYFNAPGRGGPAKQGGAEMTRSIWGGVIGRLGIALPPVLICMSGCFIPPSATMQSARTMEPRQVRVAPYAASINEKYEGEREEIGGDYGALLGIGTGSNAEIQLRYDRFQDTDGDGYNFTSFGPKFSVVKDRCAILLPVGVYWGQDISIFETVQIDPAVIGSVPVGKFAEINAAGKFVFPLNSDLWKWGVVNFGVSLSSDTSQWAVIPEIGFAWNLSEDDASSLFTYGIAFAYYPRLKE